jgi:YGGT family
LPVDVIGEGAPLAWSRKADEVLREARSRARLAMASEIALSTTFPGSTRGLAAGWDAGGSPLMTLEEQKTVIEGDEPAAQGSVTTTRRTSTVRPSGGEFARRVIVLIFGLIQVLIALRILLLLLNAREGNAIVRAILDVSQLFVAPFEGILRTDALHASDSTLDLAAVVAFIGWTVVELIVVWVVNIFRREPA